MLIAGYIESLATNTHLTSCHELSPLLHGKIRSCHIHKPTATYTATHTLIAYVYVYELKETFLQNFSHYRWFHRAFNIFLLALSVEEFKKKFYLIPIFNVGNYLLFSYGLWFSIQAQTTKSNISSLYRTMCMYTARRYV